MLLADDDGVYRPQGRTLAFDQTLPNAIATANWKPIAGDFDRNGTVDLGIVEFSSGQMILHVYGQSPPVSLYSNARASDRILVGNWAQSQWSSNVFYGNNESYRQPLFKSVGGFQPFGQVATRSSRASLRPQPLCLSTIVSLVVPSRIALSSMARIGKLSPRLSARQSCHPTTTLSRK